MGTKHRSKRLPAVEEFLAAVGYTGDANLVAVYWTPGGDEACYTDGRSGGTGEWRAFLAYVDYPPIRKWIAGDRWNLGSSDSLPTHYLLFNREESTGMVIPIKAGDKLLQEQHPDPFAGLTEEEVADLVKQTNAALQDFIENYETTMPTVEEIQMRMREQNQRIDALQKALLEG